MLHALDSDDRGEYSDSAAPVENAGRILSPIRWKLEWQQLNRLLWCQGLLFGFFGFGVQPFVMSGRPMTRTHAILEWTVNAIIWYWITRTLWRTRQCYKQGQGLGFNPMLSFSILFGLWAWLVESSVLCVFLYHLTLDCIQQLARW